MSIQERQNRPRSLTLLAAQRYLYSHAKKYRNATFALILINVALGLIASGVDNKHLAQSLTVFVFLFWAVDKLVLAAKERNARTEAATIQEMFDCLVLDLPWPSYKGIQQPTEDRLRQLETLSAKEKFTRNLENWYSLSGIPDDPILARLRCQRTNFWWDVDLRRRWRNWINGTFVAFLVLLIVFAGLTGLTVVKLIAILASGFRALAWGLNEHNSQSAAIKRLNAIHSFLSKPGGTPPSIVDVRGVQDALFEHRRSVPPIPDWFYWWHRPRQEKEVGGVVNSYNSRN